MNKRDVALIKALQADGRASYASLARRLKVGESTVRRRMRHLLKEQTILITALADPFKVGLDHCALIGLDVDLPRLDSVMEALAKEDMVHFVASTAGRYDVFIAVHCSSQKELATFVSERLSVVEGIRQSETFIYLKLRKWNHHWAIWQRS